MEEPMVTKGGVKHGLITMYVSESSEEFKNMKPALKAEMEKKKKDDNRIIKAKFVHYKDKNGRLEMPYCKYSGDPVLMYKFLNGYTYNVPKGLVDQVNEAFIVKRSEILDRDGLPTKTDEVEKLYEFVPASF